MIPYDFEYVKPAAVEEAVQLFGVLEEQGKQPVYYSGGTEILTLGRLNLLQTHAVIDIKGIPLMRILKEEQDRLMTGAALTLTELEEDNRFPLLTAAAKGVADRTARNKITLGGNICGQIYYREAVLPLLLADSVVMTAGKSGFKRRSIHEVFHQTLQLEKGECLVLFGTDRTYLNAPYFHMKRRKQWDDGYPLLTAAALKKDNRLRAAFSGVCPFPFRSREMEEELNRQAVSFETRIDRALQRLPSPVLDDAEGSREYRIFVLRNTLLDMLLAFEGGQDGGV